MDLKAFFRNFKMPDFLRKGEPKVFGLQLIFPKPETASFSSNKQAIAVGFQSILPKFQNASFSATM